MSLQRFMHFSSSSVNNEEYLTKMTNYVDIFRHSNTVLSRCTRINIGTLHLNHPAKRSRGKNLCAYSLYIKFAV